MLAGLVGRDSPLLPALLPFSLFLAHTYLPLLHTRYPAFFIGLPPSCYRRGNYPSVISSLCFVVIFPEVLEDVGCLLLSRRTTPS